MMNSEEHTSTYTFLSKTTQDFPTCEQSNKERELHIGDPIIAHTKGRQNGSIKLSQPKRIKSSLELSMSQLPAKKKEHANNVKNMVTIEEVASQKYLMKKLIKLVELKVRDFTCFGMCFKLFLVGQF